MKINNIALFSTLKAAEAQADKMNRESGNEQYVATQVYEDRATGFGVMYLGDRSVYGVGGAYVKGTRWD